MRESAARVEYRFGPYQFAPSRGVLRKLGVRIRLQRQPRNILAALLEHQNETVTREYLRQLLWPVPVHVDFEQGLNVAVAKLREALCDSALEPKYIETLPGIGYRFIASVDCMQPESGTRSMPTVESAPATLCPNTQFSKPAIRYPWYMQAGIAVALLLLVLRMIPAFTATAVAPAQLATTTSPVALKLFSEAHETFIGMEADDEDSCKHAAGLLEEALRLDPDFASAHIYLAHAYSNLGQEENAGPHYERAYQLRTRVPDRERYFIEGSYFQRFRVDRQLATQAYEALLVVDPQNYWGINNIIGLYLRAGRRADATEMVERRGELRPSSFATSYDTWLFLVRTGELGRAKQWQQRALSLSANASSRFIPAIVELSFYPVWEAVEQGHIQTAIRRAGQLNHQSESRRDSSFRNEMSAHQAYFNLTIGRFSRAREFAQSLPDRSFANWLLFRVSLAEHPGLEAKYILMDYIAHRPDPDPAVLAMAASLVRTEEERQLLRKKASTVSEDGASGVSLVRGAMLIAENRPKEAMPLLMQVAQETEGRIPSRFFLASRLYAEAAVRSGDRKSASEQVLERCVALGRFDPNFGLREPHNLSDCSVCTRS